MTKPLSLNLRRRVVDAIDAGQSCRAAAAGSASRRRRRCTSRWPRSPGGSRLSMASGSRRPRCIASSAVTVGRSKKSAHAAEHERADVAAARDAWFEAQPDLDPERLIFIDETWLNTKMTRLRGRAPRGERLRSPIPHGHWRTTTFVAGPRLSGIDAPMVIDGPVNGEIFLAYVRRVLVPALRPGDVVIMDNLGSTRARPCARPSRRRAPRSTSSRSTART